MRYAALAAFAESDCGEVHVAWPDCGSAGARPVMGESVLDDCMMISSPFGMLREKGGAVPDTTGAVASAQLCTPARANKLKHQHKEQRQRKRYRGSNVAIEMLLSPRLRFKKSHYWPVFAKNSRS